MPRIIEVSFSTIPAIDTTAQLECYNAIDAVTSLNGWIKNGNIFCKDVAYDIANLDVDAAINLFLLDASTAAGPIAASYGVTRISANVSRNVYYFP